MTNWTVAKGDTMEETATLTAAGAAYNLTGCTLWWTLKRDVSADDTDALIKLYWVSGGASDGITVATPANGQALVTLTPAQTDALGAATYQWDLQLKDGANRVFTVDSGQLVVKPDVTRRSTTP